jgi:hypothetical protein
MYFGELQIATSPSLAGFCRIRLTPDKQRPDDTPRRGQVVESQAPPGT